MNSVKDIEIFGQLSQEKRSQFRFSVEKNKMVLDEVQKSKFAQINDKRYYFSDAIVSLPFSPPLLGDIIKFKEEKKKGIEKYILEEKQNLLNFLKVFFAEKHFVSKTSILSNWFAKKKL